MPSVSKFLIPTILKLWQLALFQKITVQSVEQSPSASFSILDLNPYSEIKL
jgi:hypothetical protein